MHGLGIYSWPEDSFQYDGEIEKGDVDEYYEQCIEKFRGCLNWHPVEKKNSTKFKVQVTDESRETR